MCHVVSFGCKLAGLAALVLLAGLAVTSGTVSAASPPSNDDFENATEISTLPFTDSQNIQDATLQAPEPSGCSWDQTVWYRYTPLEDTVALVTTTGSDFDARFAVHAQPGPPASSGLCWGAEKLLVFKGGVTVWFQVGGDSPTGNLVFELTEQPLTPIATPVPGPTPTPGGPELMLSAPGSDCDDSVAPTTCDVPTEAQFTIRVSASTVPPNGYILMQTLVRFGEHLTLKPTEDLLDEIIWPQCEPLTAVRIQWDQTRPPTADGSLVNSHEVVTHGCISGILPPLPASTYAGALVEFSLTCSQMQSNQVLELLPYSEPAGSTVAGTNGSLFQSLNGIQVEYIVPKLDSLTINCVEPSAVGGVTLDGGLAAAPEAGGGSGLLWRFAGAIVVGLVGVAGWRAARLRHGG